MENGFVKKEINKILGIVMGVLFYLFIPLLFIVDIGLNEEIWYYSHVLFIICDFYIPVILLLLPLIFSFKKEFYKSILYTLLIVIIYIFMIVLLKNCIVIYIKDFTVSKWNNYSNLRYLMIESFEQKYKIVGRKKEYIYDLLGEPTSGVFDYDEPNSFCYEIGYSLLDVDYYCFVYDDNNIIVESK